MTFGKKKRCSNVAYSVARARVYMSHAHKLAIAESARAGYCVWILIAKDCYDRNER